jgi:hypothetical protein
LDFLRLLLLTLLFVVLLDKLIRYDPEPPDCEACPLRRDTATAPSTAIARSVLPYAQLKSRRSRKTRSVMK